MLERMISLSAFGGVPTLFWSHAPTLNAGS